MTLEPPFRRATIDDAPTLAELVNHAGEGLPLYLWGKMAAPGETAWDVGRRRAARQEGSFSYRNAMIVEQDSQCAGCLIGYEIPDDPAPIADDMPAMFVPLQELENLAPGTWYVNVLAVLLRFRRQGLGTKTPGPGGRDRAVAGEAGDERHRFGCEYRRAATLRALQLPRGGHAGHGQGGVAERRTGLGSADEETLSEKMGPE